MEDERQGGSCPNHAGNETDTHEHPILPIQTKRKKESIFDSKDYVIINVIC